MTQIKHLFIYGFGPFAKRSTSIKLLHVVCVSSYFTCWDTGDVSELVLLSI